MAGCDRASRPPEGGQLYLDKATYDRNDVNDDVFDMDNMVEGATTKILTDAERTNLSNQSGVNTGDQVVLGYVLATWGANITTIGYHPAINGIDSGPEIANLSVAASAKIPADGTIDTVTYFNLTGDATTEFQIILNGALAHTFTCVGPYGCETGIGVAVAVGDNTAIRYSAGTAPGNGIYSMYVN